MKKDFWVKFLATGFGCGYSPLFPGGVGTVLGFVVSLGLFFLPYSLRIILILSLVFLAIPISTQAEQLFRKKDAHEIVIDEVIGVLIASIALKTPGWMLLFGFRLPIYLFLGFLLFALFDAFKPYPANRAQKLPGGLGVVLDDIIAGGYAAIVLMLLIKLI